MTQRVVNYTYGTGNPVLPDGSIDVRDGIDNLQSMDVFMNAPEDTYNQRDGDIVRTVAGMNNEFDAHILNMGFTRIGTFAAGSTLTNPRQTLLWDVADGGDGQEYGWSGAFPKVVPAASAPASTGGISVGAWISRFDPELKVQVREALRRIYAEAGYNLVAGSFEAGGTLANSNDVLLHEASGKAYSFDGPLPQAVPPGANPMTSGYVDRSHALLRNEVQFYIANREYNVADYGASPSKTGAENHAIFLTVEGLAKAVGGRVYVPHGVYLRAGDTIMDGRHALVGAHNAVQNHGDTKGSIIKYEGNYGLRVTNSAKVLIEDLAFQQVGGTTAIGIDLQAAGRSTLSRVTVDGFAGDGIVAVNGNLSSYTDIICLNNGGDGFKLAGLPTPDINCASLRNIDSRGNAGNGINLDSAWNVMGFGLVAQSNTGYGVVVNNCRQSFLIIYSENNTAGSIHYTDHPNNEGNFIFESFVDVASVDDSKRENTVLKSKAGADTWSMFEEVVCKSLLIPNASALGTLRLKHDTNARHDFYAEKTGQSQTLRWKNVANLSDIDADAPIYPFIHHFVGSVVRRDRLIFANGDTAPNVSLSEFWLANNTAATTITSFAGGVDGQKIMVVFNNGNTTIQHSSTNTGVRLKGGVTKTFSQYEGTTFVKNGTNWWIEV